MWACARGHKDAMLMLNQWNPLALLGLISRCSLASLSNGHNQFAITSSSTVAKTTSTNGYSIDRDATSLGLSSSSQKRRNTEDFAPPWVDRERSAPPNFSFQPPPLPSTFSVPEDRRSIPTQPSFSPTNLLSTRDVEQSPDERDDLESDESELVHVEESFTISFTADDRPTSASKKRTTRLKKRTSVDIIPSFMQRRTNTPKISKTASVGDPVEIPAELAGSPDTWPMAVIPPGELRVSSSDSHLSGLSKLHSSAAGPDPMISMIDHDINSPPMMFNNDESGEIPPVGFPLDPQPTAYALPCESMAVDIGMMIAFVV